MTPDDAPAALVRLAAAREGHGRARVVAVEGRSGAGKTTFAERVADAVQATGVPRPPVLHMDDLYPGWDGLEAATLVVARVLAGVAAGGPARYRAWDWAADRPGGWVEVPVTDWLVVEGVGCGAAPARPHLTALAWLEAPAGVRRRRALDRDGETYLPHWQRWADQEERLLARDDVRAAADLVVRTA